MKLHELSVKRPVAVIMAILIFVVIGAYSLSMLKMEAMPEMDLSMAVISTSYPNVGSEEIENLVTKPIESAVSTVSGIDTITSQSSEGSSLIMVQFATGTDMDEAVGSMETNIDMISGMLPEDATEPMVIKIDTSALATAQMSVSYEGYDLVQTKKFVEDNVQNKLEAIEGVGSVNVSGAQDRVIEVVVDPDKMFGYDMNMSALVGAIAAQNQNVSSGNTQKADKKMSVRTLGKFKKYSDIEAVPITTSTGQVVYIRDIATVRDTYSEGTTFARLNSVDSLSISIGAESDANTVEVVEALESELKKLEKEYPGFTYNMTMEQASYIKDAISSVAENAITGGLLAIIILLLFLGSVRSSLIIGVSMPVSIITTFIGMYFSGMTLNVVSLGGLALGVGMLVDNSVVVLENITRRREELGEDNVASSINGAKEMISSVVASVLTTCIVYVPIVFIDNIMAVMFKQLAFSIIFSQLAALIVTFLIIPMFTSRINYSGGKNKMLSVVLTPAEKFIDFLHVIYEKALRWVLAHRKLFAGCVIGLFVLCIILFAGGGMTLMDMTDEGNLTVSVELPKGTRVEKTDALTKEIEEIIKQNDNVNTIFSTVGSGGMLGGTSSNSASISVTLNEDRKKTTQDITNDIREALKNVSGAEITVGATNSAMSFSSDSLEFQFTATDDEKLENYVIEAADVLASIDGVTETGTSVSETRPEARININETRAASYGMNTTTLAQLVKYATDGTTASKLNENGSEYDIRIVYPDNYVRDYNELKDLRIKTPTGQWISLSDVADVTTEEGSSTLTRINQKRVLSVNGTLYGRDMASVKTEFENKIKNELPMPDGITMTAAGSYETMMDAMKSLFIAILLGILLMYMVMAAQFENIIQPIIILFTIPLALIGVEVSLLVFRSTFSVVSCIGVLMLMGIIVNNAIVLIDFINTERRENPDGDRIEAVVKSGKTRMRPILMTSLTSILGFLPMAVSTADGAEMMRPMAVVLLGGLFIGTLLTLFFIPVMYIHFDNKHIKRMKKKERKAGRTKMNTENGI